MCRDVSDESVVEAKMRPAEFETLRSETLRSGTRGHWMAVECYDPAAIPSFLSFCPGLTRIFRFGSPRLAKANCGLRMLTQ